MIRRATVADARALATMRWRFRTELGRPVEDESDFISRCTAWMREVLGTSAWLAWVAEVDGHPVGCCWLHVIEKVPNPVDEAESHAYLTNEFVEPGCRGMGMGSKLLAAALAAAESLGVDEVVLWRSDGSRSLYERHGFVEPAEQVMTRPGSGSPRASPAAAGD